MAESRTVCHECTTDTEKKFCAQCGRRMRCPICNTFLGHGFKFCEECGHPVNKTQVDLGCTDLIQPEQIQLQSTKLDDFMYGHHVQDETMNTSRSSMTSLLFGLTPHDGFSVQPKSTDQSQLNLQQSLCAMPQPYQLPAPLSNSRLEYLTQGLNNNSNNPARRLITDCNIIPTCALPQPSMASKPAPVTSVSITGQSQSPRTAPSTTVTHSALVQPTAARISKNLNQLQTQLNDAKPDRVPQTNSMRTTHFIQHQLAPHKKDGLVVSTEKTAETTYSSSSSSPSALSTSLAQHLSKSWSVLHEGIATHGAFLQCDEIGEETDDGESCFLEYEASDDDVHVITDNYEQNEKDQTEIRCRKGLDLHDEYEWQQSDEKSKEAIKENEKEAEMEVVDETATTTLLTEVNYASKIRDGQLHSKDSMLLMPLDKLSAHKRVAAIQHERCYANLKQTPYVDYSSEEVQMLRHEKILEEKMKPSGEMKETMVTDNKNKTKHDLIAMKCPVCEKTLLNISRHLKRTHLIKDTKYWRSIFYCKRKSKSKKSRPLKDCPIDGCLARVQRLDHHMTNVHQQYKYKASNTAQRKLVGEKVMVNDMTYKVEVKGFQRWMQTPDGGCKDPVSAKICASQMSAIFTVSGLGPNDLIVDQDRLRDTLLKTICKEKRPGTVLSYLGTVKLYIRYRKMYEIDEQIRLLLEALEARMKHWTICVRKEQAKRRWEVRQRDTREKIEPEDIQSIESSNLLKKARKIIASSVSKENVTRSDFTFVRNILMTTVLIHNAQRSGTLRNMTMGEYRSSEEIKRNLVTVVKNVKTLGAQGPARIVFSGASKELMAGYVRNIRSKIPYSRDDNAYLFSTYEGKRICSSGISRVMNSMAKKCGIKKKFTPTTLRKSVVTLVHERLPERKEQLASHMGHSVSTAVSYYRLQENISRSCETVDLITDVLGSKVKQDKIEQEEEEAEGERNGEEADDNKTKGKKTEMTIDDCANIRWNQCFTEKETGIVRKYFDTFIKHKHMPTLAEVKQIRETVDRPDMEELAGKSEIQIRDKVRTLYRCKHI